MLTLCKHLAQHCKNFSFGIFKYTTDEVDLSKSEDAKVANNVSIPYGGYNVGYTYDVNTKSGSGFNERKPNGTIHFVEATTAKAGDVATITVKADGVDSKKVEVAKDRIKDINPDAEVEIIAELFTQESRAFFDESVDYVVDCIYFF